MPLLWGIGENALHPLQVNPFDRAWLDISVGLGLDDDLLLPVILRILLVWEWPIALLTQSFRTGRHEIPVHCDRIEPKFLCRESSFLLLDARRLATIVGCRLQGCQRCQGQDAQRSNDRQDQPAAFPFARSRQFYVLLVLV